MSVMARSFIMLRRKQCRRSPRLRGGWVRTRWVALCRRLWRVASTACITARKAVIRLHADCPAADVALLLRIMGRLALALRLQNDLLDNLRLHGCGTSMYGRGSACAREKDERRPGERRL